MAKKNFWLGMLALVLVFGMAVVGCDDDNGDTETNYFDALNLSTSNPSSAILSAVGLTQTQFNQIRDAADGGFQGWDTMFFNGNDNLLMAWSGRSVSNFNSVADILTNIFDEQRRGNEAGLYEAAGNDNDYLLRFYSV
jgi:hypothetical protein